MKGLNWIDIKWIGKIHDRDILLIPIRFKGVKKVQFIQIDTACPHSPLFEYQLSQIFDELPNEDKIDLDGFIGNYEFNNFEFQIMRNYGEIYEKYNQNKLGVLGAGFFKNKILIIDFQNDRIVFSDSLDILDLIDDDFYFVPCRKNRANVVVFDLKLNDKSYPGVLYDSGASMYDLIVQKHDWLEETREFNDSKISKQTVGCFGEFHEIIGKKINGIANIGNSSVPIDKIYTRDSEIFEVANLTGIIGSSPFFNHKVVIDWINFRFGLSVN